MIHISRRVRVGTAALTAGLLLGVVPGIASPVAAQAATPTRITLRANHGTYTVGNRITLAAHLGLVNRTVTFYEAYRGQRSHVIKRSTTNRSGNAVIVGPARYSATYTVAFGGDGAYGGSSARASVNVRAALAIVASGGSKKKGYRLYRQSKKATVAAAVAPSKTGERIKFRLQVRRNGHYRTIDTRKYTLRKGSAVAITYRGKAGKRYRVRAEYGGGTLNAGNHSAWTYSRFRR